MFDLFSSKPTYPNGKFTDGKLIASAIQDAILKHETVELRLDKNDAVFSTFLANPPTQEGTTSLFVAPLEPAIGNTLMRRSKEVELRFVHGMQAFTTVCQYVQSIIMPQSALHQITYPKEMQASPFRKEIRARIPLHYNIVVNVSLKRDRLFSSRVVDISGTGMMFENPMTEEQLPVDTILFLEIIPMNIPKLHGVEVHGQVRRHVKIRRDESGASVIRLAGVRFMKFSDDVEAMAKYINKIHEKELEDTRKKMQGIY